MTGEEDEAPQPFSQLIVIKSWQMTGEEDEVLQPSSISSQDSWGGEA